MKEISDYFSYMLLGVYVVDGVKPDNYRRLNWRLKVPKELMFPTATADCPVEAYKSDLQYPETGQL